MYIDILLLNLFTKTNYVLVIVFRYHINWFHLSCCRIVWYYEITLKTDYSFCSDEKEIENFIKIDELIVINCFFNK